MKKLKVLLIVIAVICIGVAASYPIRYKLELDSNNSELEDLSSMRRRAMEEQHLDAEPAAEPAEAMAEPTAEPERAAAQPGEAPEAPVEATEPVETEAPEDTALPTQAENEPTAETTALADTQAPSDTAAPEDTATPSGEQTPVDTEVPAEPEAPKDTAIPAQAATGAATPADTQTPTDAEAPADAQTPVDTMSPMDTQSPLDTALPDVAATPATTRSPGLMELLLDDAFISTATPPATSTPTPTPGPTPSPTPDRSIRSDADTFKDKVKVRLDEDKILPELREIYELNHDLVGWLYIEDTNIDYPVVQAEDGKFYLTHDFYGRSNANGQIILEDKCDPYTPSYNLVLSGHHMNSGAMFGRLGRYKDKDYWETHKIVEFDTLMARKRYVVFAAFYSADYDEHEEGFRYSADIQYNIDAEMWLDEIRANQIYETGIDAEFGDEFITLTTCDHSRRYDGRFVVVARRIREGEKFQ